MAKSDFKKYGLVGRNISYSFSKKYFTDKFITEELKHFTYENFDIADISLFQAIIAETKDLHGLNVTIPYKESVLPYLHKINKKALKIGAVNTIKITKNKKLKGYNTDYFGFKKALQPFLKLNHTKALILGTGGASKAIAYALKELNITFKFVSREATDEHLTYEDLNEKIFNDFHLIINCTPLGTFPNINECPPLPYHLFTENHLAFDLIYNPAETTFLKNAQQNGAQISNGHLMLIYQAEKAWSIWNK